MIVKVFLNILMPLTIVLAFLWVPSAQLLGHSSRIIYFHVPVAWVSVLSYIVSGVYSIRYLMEKERKSEVLEKRAHASAVLGLLFTVLATVTGSIWAKMSWGSYWNWDPRETSIVILLLIYVAYLSLRSSMQGSSGRGRISSVYLIISMAVMPFFVFVVPRVYQSLHPQTIINPGKKALLDASMRLVLFLGIASFTLLFIYLYSIIKRIIAVEEKIKEIDHE